MNDNQPFTSGTQLFDWIDRARDYNSLREEHPHLQGLPDYGLLLKPKDETRFRVHAQSYGVNYEKVKEEFIWSHQVIPFRPLDESWDLIAQHAIPLNYLKRYFDQYLAIFIRCELRKRDRQQK